MKQVSDSEDASESDKNVSNPYVHIPRLVLHLLEKTCRNIMNLC